MQFVTLRLMIALAVTDGDVEEGRDLDKPHQIFFTDIPIKQEHSEELTNYHHEDGSGFLAPIKLESVTEESAVHSVIKEEVIVENVHNEDINEVCTVDATTVISVMNMENNGQRDFCCGKSDFIEQLGLSETNSDLSQICKCDICNIYFANFSILSRHKLLKHSGVGKFHCDVCNKVFPLLYSLSRHKVIHGDLKYLCGICNRAFNRMCSLTTHKLIHDSKKRFQCNVCSRAFKRSSTLSNHKMIHSGIKKYQCDVCNRAFTWKSSLTAHKISHEDVKADSTMSVIEPYLNSQITR